MTSGLFRTTLLAGLSVVSIAGLSAVAQEKTFSDAQTKAIEKVVKDYLVKHPEVVRDALIELEKRQVAEQEKQQHKAIASNADLLFRSKTSFVGGNPKGDVTVVEFFDYNCTFCKRAFKDLVKLIETDKNVRVVFKELPIFGEASIAAARVAIASTKQNKYFEFHSALLRAPGRATEAAAMKIAKELKLDIDQLKKDMKSKFVDEALAESQKLANDIGLQGTPLYLVGDKIIPGAPEDLYDRMVKMIADVRKNGCKQQVSC